VLSVIIVADFWVFVRGDDRGSGDSACGCDCGCGSDCLSQN